MRCVAFRQRFVVRGRRDIGERTGDPHGDDRGKARCLHQDTAAGGREIMVATSNKGWNESVGTGAWRRKQSDAHPPFEALQPGDPRLRIRLVRVRLANLALSKKVNL